MTNVVGALFASAIGLMVVIGGVLSQLGESPAVVGWAQVGGIATAVGALSYVAKLLADGKLVAQPISELQRSSAAREDRLIIILEQAKEREDAFKTMLINKERNRDRDR